MISQAQQAYDHSTTTNDLAATPHPERYTTDANVMTSQQQADADDVKWSPHALAQFERLGRYSDVSPQPGSVAPTDRSLAATPHVARREFALITIS